MTGPTPEHAVPTPGADLDAFRRLYEEWADRVHTIALHFTHDEAAAQDVTQQVFLKLMSKLDSFRGDARLSTWLFRLVANECIDHHRRRRRFVPAADRAAPATQEANHLRDAEAERVRRAVASLSPKLRIAVLLRHFEELSYDDMAVALGCSTGTVASRLYRAHAQLARALRQERS
jgi:RNA polymerase sigma-70 factor (ECF subfamily)